MINKYSLPLEVENGGKIIKIRNECDYRVVLDCIAISKDDDIPDRDKTLCTLQVFFENFEDITDVESAVHDMINIIENRDTGSQENRESDSQPMADFNIDFNIYVAPLNAKLGYDVRTPKFTHWWTFLSAYSEIGDCFFAEVVRIRTKRYKDKKPLDKSDREFYTKNWRIINAIFPVDEETLAYLNEED